MHGRVPLARSRSAVPAVDVQRAATAEATCCTALWGLHGDQGLPGSPDFIPQRQSWAQRMVQQGVEEMTR